MNRLIRFLFCGICTLILVTSAKAATADLDDPAVLEAWVDGIVDPLMKNNNSPSGTVAIARSGQILLAKGYGYQNIEKRIPVDPATTLFRPGSTSKLFTWVAVMQQAERGKIDLDTDVNTYLKGFKIRETFEEPITLRHILTHTAGFEDGGMGYLIIEDPDHAITLAEAMERYQPERVNPPGAQTAYSNYATALAGLIVAEVSGLSFNDYIQQNLFDPLGMKSSSFVEPLPADLLEDMAVSYDLEAGSYVEKPFEIIASFGPAGALSSTATDMIRFGQAILNGGELDGQRILKPETLREMLTRSFTHDNRMMGMALGFYESDYNGTRLVGHGGDTQWFHSYLGIDQEHDLTLFVSFGGTGGSPVRSSFTPAFYNAFFPRDEAPPEPPEDFKDRAGKYAGGYNFWRGNFSKVEKAASVASSIKVMPTEEGTLIITLAGKAKHYTEVGPNLFRESNKDVSILPGLSPRLLAFQENDQGDITGFVMDGLPFMSLRKLAFYETSNFNFTFLGLSFLIFLGVLLRRFYQRSMIQSLSADDKSAVKAAVYASASNWLVLVAGVIILSIVKDRFLTEVPFLFKFWLVFPIIATLAGLFLAFRTIGVWRNGLLGGFWSRVRYSLVTLSALFVCWFYWFWNILGFQYL